MSEPEKKDHGTKVAGWYIAGAIGGALNGWELSYAVHWLIGTWLPALPLVVTGAYYCLTYVSREVRENDGKPPIGGSHLFGNLIGFTWFALWILTFTSFVFPVIK